MINEPPVMSEKEYFRIHRLPWIFYGAGVAATVGALLVRIISTPQLAPWWLVLILVVLGLALGTVLGKASQVKLSTPGDYLSMMGGMRISWIVCIIVLLIAFNGGIAYYMALFVTPFSISFFFLYLPHYIEIRDQKYYSVRKTK